MLAAAADDAVIVTDMDIRVRVWNAAAERLYGIHAEDALGRVIFDLTDARVVGEGHVPIRLPREIALATGAWHGRVIERPRTGQAVGREVVVETTLSRLAAPDGIPRGVLNIKRDITASYRLEQELAALGTLATATGGARSRAEIAQNAIDVLCQATEARSGVIIRFESAGVSIDARQGLDDSMCRQVVDLAASDRTVRNAIRTPGAVVVGSVDEIRMNDEARSWLDSVGLRAIAVVGLHRGDELVGALAMGWTDRDAPRPSSAVLLQASAHVERAIENARLVEEITVRADAEQALVRRLERSEARYRTLFEASPDAYLLCDLAGIIIEANGAANELYGASLVGGSVGEFLDVDPDEGARRRSAVDRGEHRRFTGTARRADGSHFPRETEASRVRIDDHERYLIVIRDLTERQRLQTELVQAQKMETVGILVSGVAHELNNPIASIIGLSTIIGRDPGLSRDLRENAALLVGEAQRAGHIVRTFLDFVRSRPPERHPTPLKPLLETVRELQSYSKKSGVDWVINVQAGLPRVAIDRSQIQQVMINLTTNAIQAILADRPTGRLEIDARRGRSDDGRRTVRIMVTDDGPGVAPLDRTKLFVPFFTTKAPGQGTGLGLPVTFDIVRRHNGTLTYEPAPGGRGARFIVELPVEAPPSAPAARWPSPPAPAARPRGRKAVTPRPSTPRRASATRRPRALILDDEESIRIFLRKVLGAAGFETVVAADGETAISAVRSGPIDVALVDHRMPGMTGIEAFEEAIAARPELAGRWLFMSGDVLNPDLQEFAEARGLPLLAKPFDLASVNRAVGEIVDRLGLAD
jgi:two-component system NtrC family sensor kinase